MVVRLLPIKKINIFIIYIIWEKKINVVRQVHHQVHQNTVRQNTVHRVIKILHLIV
jgi:hypothetical protein